MLIPVLVSGVAIGSIYALIALAIVLIYKATDVVNFAQGEMAMFATFLGLTLFSVTGVSLVWVVLMSFPIGALLGMAAERSVMRPLRNAPPLNALIVSIGLWIIFHYGAGWIWGFEAASFPSLLPQKPIDVLGAKISPNSLAIAAITAAVLFALYIFFEHTREGTAMRAASMNQQAARLMGISVGRVSLLAWAIAGGIGALAGVLVAPMTFIDVNMMFMVLLKSLAGAVLGGFTSLPGAVLGGVLIGVAESLVGVYVSAAFDDALAFLMIVLVLMIRPEGILGKPSIKKV